METVFQSAEMIREEVEKADRQFEILFEQGDAKGMSKLYLSDGILLAPGAPMIKGQEAIAGFWQMAMSMGIRKATLTTLDVECQGELAVELGEYRLSGDNDQPIDNGKFIVVWKQENGAWKLSKDIWNTNVNKS